MGFWDYFKAIAAIGIVLAAAFYLTKLVAKSNGGAFRKATGMKLRGNLPLARDKSVAVVEIGRYAYILGVSGQRVERLDKVELSELQLEEEQPAPVSFTSAFKSELLSRMKKFR